MLVVDCLNKNAIDMAECLVNPGGGAAPGGGWGGVPTATCNDYDRKAMIECLTGTGDSCCFVLGINRCVLLMDGQPVTIFQNA